MGRDRSRCPAAPGRSHIKADGNEDRDHHCGEAGYQYDHGFLCLLLGMNLNVSYRSPEDPIGRVVTTGTSQVVPGWGLCVD